MNKYVLPAITFATGAVIGATAAWITAKKIYEKIADEEIEEMREYYWDKLDELDETYVMYADEEEPNKEEFDEMARQHAEAIIEKAGYGDVVKTSGPISAAQVVPDEEEDNHMDDRERPYVITPEEFDEIDEYNTISLTYFADEVLTDDQMNVVDNIDEIVGLDSLSHFGEYEDDSVFVRNDKLKTDYEILLDTKTYEEIMAARVE